MSTGFVMPLMIGAIPVVAVAQPLVYPMTVVGQTNSGQEIKISLTDGHTPSREPLYMNTIVLNPAEQDTFNVTEVMTMEKHVSPVQPRKDIVFEGSFENKGYVEHVIKRRSLETVEDDERASRSLRKRLHVPSRSLEVTVEIDNLGYVSHNVR